MPYIKQSQKDNLDPAIDELVNRIAMTSEQDKCELDGMLNYAMTRLLLLTLMRGMAYYVRLERGIGCLEACKQEFYRRVAAPYEDLKAKENGDVFNW